MKFAPLCSTGEYKLRILGCGSSVEDRMKKSDKSFKHDSETVAIPEAYVIDDLNNKNTEKYEENGLVSPPSYSYEQEEYLPNKPEPSIVIVIEF